ncbi:hypothetical protein [Marinobacter shengliensis]|uniref:hypothetical protein n=1 Tax=Marinobacter shengliensis TaxID=1389223 RepID=UPI0011095CA4|nr:hypothetical protein [Marinobacter shengliensis]
MNNRYGVDATYFITKLGGLVQDIWDYTPEELARSLARLAQTANAETLKEPEFQPPIQFAPVPEGYSLVPKHMTLDLDAMQRLCAMTGDSFTEDEFGECTLWVGETHDENGSTFHGLNATLTEYPEEGALPIVEFPAPAAPPQPSCLDGALAQTT